VQKVTTIEFDADGFLKHVHIIKNSELYAAAKLPLDVLSAIADGFTLRAKIVNRQKSVAEKEIALLKAQTSLAATQAATPNRAALEAGVQPAGPNRRSSGAKSFAPPVTSSGELE
jgi:hypothetical protein